MKRRLSTALLGVLTTTAVLASTSGAIATAASTTETEFVHRADAVCAKFAPRFAQMPDSVDGAKPLGLGKLMHELTIALDRVSAPRRLAADWNGMTDLLDRAATKFVEAERADAAGEASDAAGEALWSLEPRAAKRFAHMVKQMHVKFKVCRFE